MKERKLNTNKLRVNKFWYLVVFFLFILFSITLCYRTLYNYPVLDITIDEFINNRNINEEIIMPNRGSIYDINGNILAQDVSSYTLVAYLNTNRGDGRYVKDKEGTAKILAEHIDVKYERILELLNRDLYQVEFGSGGRNLSQLKMEEIDNLNLDGIGFIKSTKRYYPNGDFASYLLGYTKNKEDKNGNMWQYGELGIEGYYNEELAGKSGYIKYEKDLNGNKIANSNEYIEEAVDGASVTLTIDKGIQLFIENEVKDAAKKSNAEWIILSVMDAKSGKILGYSSTPSFDPNLRNLVNYMDPLISYTYEPGSTMKTFTYMCAIDSGKYVGSDTFLSGSKTYVSEKNTNDTVTIKDWNVTGWGRISYDRGFALSSNIGIANLLDNVITKKELYNCFKQYGFGNKTGISLNGELNGDISFKYDVEAATAGYGQGITVTPIQMLQGLSIIANNGKMVKPYIVSEIVDSNGKVIIKNNREESIQIVSSKTVDKVKELLRSVVQPDHKVTTGSAYYMDGYDLIGKTGTASIYDYEKGRYLTGESDYIYSFSGLYPGDDPELIIYMAVKKPKDSKQYIAEPIKNIVTNVSNYLDIDEDVRKDTSVYLDNYLNKVTTEVASELKNKGLDVIILGKGKKIINQYPFCGIMLIEGDKVVLLTNDYDKTMIDFTDMSYKDAVNILNLMNVDYQIDGSGYVYQQNIDVSEKNDKKVILNLKEKY